MLAASRCIHSAEVKNGIWVYTSVRDEKHIIPFFFRHYSKIADRNVVQDAGSTDGTQEIVRQLLGELIQDEPWGLDEIRRRNDSHKFVREYAKDKAKWCLCVDVDEFVVGDFDQAIRDADRYGADVVQCTGWTMKNDGWPENDGRQIYDIAPWGNQGGASKPALARAGSVFEWSAGRHFVETQETRVMHPTLHLLHYRYLGAAYIRARNKRNWERSDNKLTAWSCSPEFTEQELARYAHTLNKGLVHSLDWIRDNPGYRRETAYAPHLDHSKMIYPE
jgi:glycosyltransferase involved in cell wall biosynthesis